MINGSPTNLDTGHDSFTYFAGGSLASATTNGVADAFVYDEVGNLITDSVTGGATTGFAYDGQNRLTQANVTAADGTPSTTVYGWDQTNDWRTSQGPSGNPSQITYAYTALGRLSSYHNGGSPVTDATYTYDAAGQRTKSAVTVGGTTTTTSFAYDGITLLSLAATQGSTSWRIDYLYDEEGTPYGAVYRSPATSTSPTYFSMITNDHGDVLELLDASGNAFGAYRYDAWGLPQGAGSYATGVWTQSTSLVTATLAGQIASRQVLRYANYAYDAESGFYYCSARYYDPATRQWTTADSAKADGEQSAYQYCGGDPVGKADASGLDYKQDVWKWTGSKQGHPKWQVTLKTRAWYETKSVKGTLYYKITKACAKIATDKYGRFYVLGDLSAAARGVVLPPEKPEYTSEKWESPSWVPDGGRRHMTPGQWYSWPVVWPSGEGWHSGEDFLGTSARGAVQCVFHMYYNIGGVLDTPRRTALVWPEQ